MAKPEGSMRDKMWRVTTNLEFRPMTLSVDGAEKFFRDRVAAMRGVTLPGYYRIMITIWKKGHAKESEYVYDITEAGAWDKADIRTQSMVAVRRERKVVEPGPKGVA